jgi:trimethylamine--corrinoid protein Co-methyltransferase
VTVNDETLALDVIEELGPTGDYLSHAHTMQHFREPYYSKLAEKGVYAQCLHKGGTTMEQRAGRLIDKILADHEPDPLPPDIQRDLKRIVERQ